VRCKTKIKTLLENPLMDGTSIAKKNRNPSCLVMHRKIKKKQMKWRGVLTTSIMIRRFVSISILFFGRGK
jgi:hypothetical protein